MIDRYTLSPMKELWTDERKFQSMLEVELAVCEAWAKEGIVPNKDLAVIKKKAHVDVLDILDKEQSCKHETIAFIKSVSEKIGKSSRYFHFGLTSSDVLDTSQSIVMKEAMELIILEARKLRKIVFKSAKTYKKLPIMGRTHGVHAEPTTLGLKFLNWVYELDRDMGRLNSALKTISYGEISGSVGTYTHVAPSVEKYVCKKLNLKPALISSQILERDRYSEYLYAIAMLGNTLEKMSTEIRNLHRTEIDELNEPFGEKQKGSSSMPHKKNPILCERICGLSRLLRGNLATEMENTCLWHERDMSHSSVERIIIPDSSCLIHFMLNDMSFIFSNLVVNEENINRNLHMSSGKIYSQALMLALTENGMPKQEAYDLLQNITLNKEGDIQEIISSDKQVLKYLDKQKIKSLCSMDYYTKYVDEIFERFNR